MHQIACTCFAGLTLIRMRGYFSTRGSPVLKGSVQLQLGSHPLFQRLASFRNARVFSKGKEVADDLRERWETSDSPLVHRIQVWICRLPCIPSYPSVNHEWHCWQAGRQSCRACTCMPYFSVSRIDSLYEGGATAGSVQACPVQKVPQVALAAQDMTENMTVETETAKTYREMRARDPAFDMIKFLRALKQDVQPVIQASAWPACLCIISTTSLQCILLSDHTDASASTAGCRVDHRSAATHGTKQSLFTQFQDWGQGMRRHT